MVVIRVVVGSTQSAWAWMELQSQERTEQGSGIATGAN